MAKRFFYVSMGVLALAVAYLLLAVDPVEADWDEGGLSCVAGGDGLYWYDQSGSAYRMNPSSYQWETASDRDLPISVSSVSFFGTLDDSHDRILITASGETWIFNAYGWQTVGSFPSCGGTATKNECWGNLGIQCVS